MKAKTFLCKNCFMVCALMFLCHCVYAQKQSAFRAPSPENDTRQLHTIVTSSDTISLEGMGNICSFSITATIHQPREASFTRIVLEDKDGHDYLVAESNWFRFDTTTVCLEHYCEETAILNGIVPACLKCYAAGDASVTLTGIHTSNQRGMERDPEKFAERAGSIKEEQVKDIVDRINTYNIRHGRLWRAAVTEGSLLPFNQKKNFHEDGSCDSYLNNIQYYAGGFFEIGTPRAYTDTIASPFVPTFDWRDRHGKCWLTPAKSQWDSWYCVPFAAVSMLESNMMLHYNGVDSIDLSEQYVAVYADVGFYSGTSLEKPIKFLMTDGTIDDVSMEFQNAPCLDPPNPRPIGNEHVFLDDYDKVNLDNIPLDTLKKFLIHKGPGVCGYRVNNGRGHAMTLAGYGTIEPETPYTYFVGNSPSFSPDTTFHEGDSLIGHTYWIYKNNCGPTWGNNGYMYIIYHNDNTWYMNDYAFFPKGTPTSNVIRPFLCEDLDGDGYFNWGVGSPHIPIWAEPDGDDSDPTIGHMNEFGYCEQLPVNHPTYEYIRNDSTLTTFVSNSNYIGVLRGATVTLQTQPTFTNGTKILLDRGATLIIDGFTVNFDFLQPYPGSKIVLNNGAIISKPFATPLGVEFVINDGSIE